MDHRITFSAHSFRKLLTSCRKLRPTDQDFLTEKLIEKLADIANRFSDPTMHYIGIDEVDFVIKQLREQKHKDGI